MAGIIHPLMPAVNEFSYYSFHDLIWIVHDKFHSKNEHYEKCVICKNSRYYALDCLKEKWDHNKYVNFDKFVNEIMISKRFLKMIARCGSDEFDKKFPKYYLK